MSEHVFYLLARLLAAVDDELLLVLLLGISLQLRVDLSGEGIGAQRSTEEKNVGLRAMVGVVFPSTALLDTQSTPLSVAKSPGLGQALGLVLGKDHVPVLELTVQVLLTILNLFS